MVRESPGEPDEEPPQLDLKELFEEESIPESTEEPNSEKEQTKYMNEINATAAELAEASMELQKRLEKEAREDTIDLDELKELAEGNPIKKLMNLVILQALTDNASDLYFEKFEHEVKMRYRINGTLYEMVPPPRSFAEQIGNELERMFGKLEEEVLTKRQKKKRINPKIKKLLNYDETAQTGVHFNKKGTFETGILTLSKIKTDSGDQYRIKIFYPKYTTSVFEDIEKPNQEAMKSEFLENSGLVVIAGLPRSGKTTAAYNLLSFKDHPDYIILVMGGEAIGIGHYISTNLRSKEANTLSQQINHFSPDIVYLDDISEYGIAEMAIEQVKKGRTIIGSINATDTETGLECLVDRGVNPKELASVFRGAIDRRFGRITHEQCKGEGCDKCFNQGYMKKFSTRFILRKNGSATRMREHIREYLDTS